MSLFPKPFIIRRITKHLGPTGVWIKDQPETLTFYGSVQPLSGFDLSVLDTGSQDKGQVWIYTTAELFFRQEGSSQAADILEYHGQDWEVMPPKPYDNELLPHNQYRAELRPKVPVT